MKHIKLLAVIAAMTICGTISAQQTFFKVSYSNAAIEMKSGRLPVTENMNGLSIGVSPASCLSSMNMVWMRWRCSATIIPHSSPRLFRSV